MLPLVMLNMVGFSNCLGTSFCRLKLEICSLMYTKSCFDNEKTLSPISNYYLPNINVTSLLVDALGNSGLGSSLPLPLSADCCSGASDRKFGIAKRYISDFISSSCLINLSLSPGLFYLKGCKSRIHHLIKGIGLIELRRSIIKTGVEFSTVYNIRDHYKYCGDDYRHRIVINKYCDNISDYIVDTSVNKHVSTISNTSTVDSIDDDSYVMLLLPCAVVLLFSFIIVFNLLKRRYCRSGINGKLSN